MGKTSCQKAYPKRKDLQKQCVKGGYSAIVKDSISESDQLQHEAQKYKLSKKCKRADLALAKKTDETDAKFKKEGPTKAVRKRAWTLDNGRSTTALSKCVAKKQG